MSGVLCLAEVNGGKLASSPDELAAAGRLVVKALGGPLTIGLVGPDAEPLADDLRSSFDHVLVAEQEALRTYTGSQALAVAEAFFRESEPAVVIASHTQRTREWLPRLAVRHDAGLVTDCVGLVLEGSTLVGLRPVFGGAAIGEFVLHTTPAFVTVRAKAFLPDAEASPASNGQVSSVQTESSGTPGESVVEEVRSDVTDGVRLRDARVVVSGGRGIGSPDNWHFIEETAAALGAAVGCSRPLVDSGWLPPTLQVGLTGTTVAPDLYVAVGISGALQHLSGIAGADHVVAVNTDPEAPIFQVAQLGVVGDFHDVLPAFVARAKELSGRG
jgi:electron transfer flavoprotein alpha subunit